MKDFRCWLRYYNLADILPLTEAIENSFKKFNDFFKVDPVMHLGLPSLAFKAMLSLYDQRLPYTYSFTPAMFEVRQLFHKNKIGGLTNVSHRMIDTVNADAPKAARLAPNGKPYTYFGFFDFNRFIWGFLFSIYIELSMYLWALAQLMPTTPGLEWILNGHYFKKSIMTSQTSFAALQWLYYVQTTLNVQLKHAYHQGEHIVDGWKVDGYAKQGNINHYYEFLGCYYHPGNLNCICPF